MHTNKSQQAGERTQKFDITSMNGKTFITKLVDSTARIQVAEVTALKGQTAKNAALLSAAPELLEAMDSMIEFIDQYATMTDCNGRNLEEDFSEFRDNAVAAIRKARGQE